ncbi:hypothetical protein G1C95_0784 [Bifidobacterium sp. DSM 109957]|uniref:Uncharacterized protein n=1 Tax=Bifidobacterium oedipodis TaxID=2675322 RepID=A0A7Y0ENK8_9BIFI|nr:hypothetical protein [Bifidobacterium sp. DSM 109957]
MQVASILMTVVFALQPIAPPVQDAYSYPSRDAFSVSVLEVHCPSWLWWFCGDK